MEHMMSDEKLEDLIKIIKSFWINKKTSINEYFKEQTGKTYKALLKDIKQLHQDNAEVKLPAYQQIVDLLNGWNQNPMKKRWLQPTCSLHIVHCLKNLKDEVDTLSKSKTNKDFIDLCKEQVN